MTKDADSFTPSITCESGEEPTAMSRNTGVMVSKEEGSYLSTAVLMS